MAENQPDARRREQENRSMAEFTFSDYERRWRAFARASLDDFNPKSPACGAEAEFDELALALFRLQFAHNPPYRRLCEFYGRSPSEVTHWSLIPRAPTVAFKECDLTCLAPAERSRVFHSSGTSAQTPSRHFHDATSLAIYETSLDPWFRANVLPQELTTHANSPQDDSASRLWIALTPPPEQAPHSSLVHMFASVARRGGVPLEYAGRLDSTGAWELDQTGIADRLAEIAVSGQPVLLLGTAFLFVHLLDYLTQRGLRLTLPAASRVLETGGYKGRSRTLSKPDLHRLMTERLGIPRSQIVCEYGMSELSSQAYDRALGVASPESSAVERVFRFPPWARARVISPETGSPAPVGETGLLQVFDLANVFSVMAIQTEDVAIVRANGFELVGRAALA